MQKLIKIIRMSSKEAIKDLKEKNPIYCDSLQKNFLVTNTFYQHILGYKKSRTNREVIERLSLINLVKKIAKEGKLKETRENQKFGQNLFLKKTFKISLRKNAIIFNIILGEKEDGNIIILSCFVTDYRKIE